MAEAINEASLYPSYEINHKLTKSITFGEKKKQLGAQESHVIEAINVSKVKVF